MFLEWQICRGIVDTVSKFASSINNTSGIGGKICRRAWVKMIHEKNLKQKIS
jgi:hypothetical protein